MDGEYGGEAAQRTKGRCRRGYGKQEGRIRV
jgi:hypothetical protein